MIHRLESLKTLSQSVFCFQTASRWGCTRIYGTLTIGQQEVVGLKRIGPELHSRLLSGTLILMGVSILTEDRLVALTNQALVGTLNKWMRRAKLDLNGFRRITWSTLTVLTLRSSHREYLVNVQQAYRIIIFYTCVWMLLYVASFVAWFVSFVMYICPIKQKVCIFKTYICKRCLCLFVKEISFMTIIVLYIFSR